MGLLASSCHRWNEECYIRCFSSFFYSKTPIYLVLCPVRGRGFFSGNGDIICVRDKTHDCSQCCHFAVHGACLYGTFRRVVFKRKTGWYDWVIITVVLGGMVLIFLERLSSGGYLGNILAVISGVVTAWLTLFLRKQKDSSPLESIILGNVLTALIGLPFMFGPRPSAAGWTGLILLGVFQLGLPFFLYTTAIKHVTALDAILVCTMEPVLNPVWVFLFLKEVPGKWAILGGSVIIAAVGLRSFFSSRGKADT